MEPAPVQERVPRAAVRVSVWALAEVRMWQALAQAAAGGPVWPPQALPPRADRQCAPARAAQTREAVQAREL